MSGLRAQPVIALDVPTLAEAEALVARLGAAADFVKVGLELFTAEGPRVVERIDSEPGRLVIHTRRPPAGRGAPG